MNKGVVSNALRKIGLLYPLDKLRFQIEKKRNEKANRKFKSLNPNIALPPDYLMYESFQMNYEKYFLGGKETARWVLDRLSKFKDLEGKNILDWGCGPGRIVRHLPALLEQKSNIYGTDYNPASIAWCKENLANILFNQNTLEAKLPYSDNFFDAIYGISIFTHLSEEMHYDWFEELTRILKPDGIMLLTTQGENFMTKLSNSERKTFQSGELVVRGNVKEGHRTYSAFHPDKFMKKLFDKNGIEILTKEVISPKNKLYIPQDTWILKKQELE